MSPGQVSSQFTRGGPVPYVSFAVRLPRANEAAGAARHVVKQRLGDLLAEEALADTLLVVSDLVSDAVLDGHGDIELRIAFDGQRVSGDVSDDGIRVTRSLPRHDPDHAGISLLGTIADSWGLHEGSNHVWFEILANRQPLYAR
jgi:hypothetical protein